MVQGHAEKTIYIPNEWRNTSSGSLLYSESDPNNTYTWSRSRSAETDNVIVFWDKGYGSTAPNNLSTDDAYYVDINDLLEKAESFYQLECNTLGFVDPTTSNVSKYKVMILINHSTEWICYGGGYDFQVPALWLSPSTCKPVGFSVAHEIGHAFHYMCYSEDSNYGADQSVQTGFHGAVGNGSVTWEQTAQWQATQSYPELMFTESIHIFRNSHNYAFTHEWQRYQSYWFFYYLCQYYNDIRTIANVWNHHETEIKDFNEVLMDYKGLSVEQLFKLYFDYALRCAAWDFDACAPYRDTYIGDFKYNCLRLSDRKYQVAYASAPQSTGFNIIELKVPNAGTAVTTRFTALVPGCALDAQDPAMYLDASSQFSSSGKSTYNTVSAASSRGFRVGYVALSSDGTRTYYNDGIRHTTGSSNVTEEITFTPPSETQRLWLVVSPAPSTYIRHLWDEDFSNDDQWPYQFELVNTDLKQLFFNEQIDGREITDVEFDFIVNLKPASDYSNAIIPLEGSVQNALNTAFQLTTSDLKTKITTSTEAGPNNGQVMGFPVTPDGTVVYTTTSAHGLFGHWFDADGLKTTWPNNSYVYSEFYNDCSFGVGQYPDINKSGDQRTIRQAIVYKNYSGQTATAYFNFYITFDDQVTNNGYAAAIHYPAVFIIGDVNRDGSITIADVTALVNIILGQDNTPPYIYDHKAANVNQDAAITIADVTALVNLILGQ